MAKEWGKMTLGVGVGVKTLIAIPAFNEGKNIGKVLWALQDARINADVLVINDGSGDETEDVARACGVVVLSHPCNMGYGSALQTSYRYAFLNGYDFLIQFDSDGQHSVDDIEIIKATFANSGSDLVLGSRFLGDANFNPGLSKMSVIIFFRAIIRLLTRQVITDPTSGLRGISRRVFGHYSRFNNFPSDFPDADVIIEVLLRNWQITEVPIRNQERIAGRSMHSGLKPLVYVFKVVLSILVVVTNVKFQRNR